MHGHGGGFYKHPMHDHCAVLILSPVGLGVYVMNTGSECTVGSTSNLSKTNAILERCTEGKRTTFAWTPYEYEKAGEDFS